MREQGSATPFGSSRPVTILVDELSGSALDSPLGRLSLVASAVGLVAILWPDDRPDRVPLARVTPDGGENRHLRAAADQVMAYLAGGLRDFDVALDLRGTPFQRQVWAALAAIPYGETCSYGAIATAIGRPTASRAVGAAVGRNPLSLIVPCHRVVGTSGGLTGFAGGLATKRHLLELESAAGRLL